MTDTDTNTTVLIDAAELPAFDVGGPTYQFLTDSDAGPQLLRGVVAPGVFVPLHSHADPECFVAIAGELEALCVGSAGAAWETMRAGHVRVIPPNVPHAFRNTASAPAVTYTTTTATLAGFFATIGVPVSKPGAGQWPPSPEMLGRLMEVSAQMGYWVGTPQDNAEVGLDLGATSA